MIYSMFKRFSTSGERHRGKAEGVSRGRGTDMMIYSMFKRFSINWELYQGKTERGGEGGGGGGGKRNRD